MIKVSPYTIALALLGCGLASAVLAASPEEERLLGCGCEQAQLESYLPFVRAIGVSGVVKGGLGVSAAEAGVPPAAMLDVLQAFATTIDLDRDVRDGDRFYVRYERSFTAKGNPIEDGHVLWAELKTAAKGTIAVHRFRLAKDGAETFWLANGQSTAPPELRMPLPSIVVTSGFGVRADPLDQPAGRLLPMGPLLDPAPSHGTALSHGLTPSPLTAHRMNAPPPPALSMGLATMSSYAPRFVPYVHRPYSLGATMALHAGVDLVAAPGTPVHAAGDGIVFGARPNGRYGNWIEIDHAGQLATVYGHLSAFAPGIVPGVAVKQGDVIGFSGNTGRTTGPHLHFEIHVNGRPTNPIGNPATKRAQLRGADLARFHKVVAQDLQERDREAQAM